MLRQYRVRLDSLLGFAICAASAPLLQSLRSTLNPFCLVPPSFSTAGHR